MVLLDTCSFLWLASNPDRLSLRAREIIGQHADALFISPISALEIAIKNRKGSLLLSIPARKWVTLEMLARGISAAPLDVETALRSAELPPLHADPFDRLLIATTQQQGWILVTADEQIRSYPELQVAW